MKLEEMKLKKLIKLIEGDIAPPLGLKEQILDNIMNEAEETIHKQYILLNYLTLKLLKITFPVTILLMMFMRIEAC